LFFFYLKILVLVKQMVIIFVLVLVMEIAWLITDLSPSSNDMSREHCNSIAVARLLTHTQSSMLSM